MRVEVDDVDSAVASLLNSRSAWSRSVCGLTRSERPIGALVDRDAYAPLTDRPRVLLVGGMSGDPSDVSLSLAALKWHASLGDLGESIALSAVPCANPGGLALGNGPYNGAGGVPGTGYPPEGGYFFDRENPEARHLWRWTSYMASDLVVELQSGEATAWQANAAASGLASGLNASALPDDDSFVSALGRHPASGLGVIPALRLTVAEQRIEAELGRLWTAIRDSPPGSSQARVELDRRRGRSPTEVGWDLAVTNGRTLEPLVYTQGVAISGRLRLAALDPGAHENTADIVPLVAPVVEDVKKILGSEPNAADVAGVVWAEELAESTGDPRYNELLVAAGSYFKPGGEGEPPTATNPDFAVEDTFMVAAVLGRAYKVTGAGAYLNTLTSHLLEGGIQEESGLFRHSRRGPFHWGRGNGFGALGHAEALTYLPSDHPKRAAIVEMCHKQMAALRHLQEPSGMYVQVIDVPGSYQELTATCMIGYAQARGLRLGWLDESFREPVERAWAAVSERVDSRGDITDGCTGSGVMDNLRSYLDRPANSGYDDRSGSMALWFAAEMARLARNV